MVCVLFSSAADLQTVTREIRHADRLRCLPGERQVRYEVPATHKVRCLPGERQVRYEVPATHKVRVVVVDLVLYIQYTPASENRRD